MQRKLWIFQLPIIVFFLFCFWITELGVHGQLSNPFFREKLYPFLSRATHILTDVKFVFRGSRPVQNKIVVVEIDSAAIEHIGRWPWHRDMMAYLIEKTFLAGAKVVGLDMVFSEPDPRIPDPLKNLLKQKGLVTVANQYETDPSLGEVIRAYSDRLVLGWTSDLFCQPLYEEPKFCPVNDPEALKLFPSHFKKFSFDHFNATNDFDPARTAMISYVTPVANIPLYGELAKNSGYFNIVLDSDGYIRKSNLLVIAGGKPYPSLALSMAKVGMSEKLQVTLDRENRVSTLGFTHSNRKIPVSPLGAIQINFRGPSSVFTHLSADDLLSESERIEDISNPQQFGKLKKEILKDAYVLIGLSAIGVYDMRQFPFEANSPGIYGHANILDNLLSLDPLISGSSGGGIYGMFLLMVLGVAVFAYCIEFLEAVPALFLFLMTIVSLFYWDFKLMFLRNVNWNTAYLYLEIGSVFFLTLAFKYVSEEKNKKFIRSAFAKYVAPVVVDSILKDPKKLSLGGEKRELTILFSDIREFTSFSEMMDAKVLASFLNDYLGIMTRLVFSNQGTLDKYIGDAIMAFWGAPLNQPMHAFNSCKAAIEMMKALKENQARFKSQYGIDVNVGIGINSGIVNVGNMGSEQNFEYTVIGDHVNLASRLEGLTKKYGVSILTSRYTFECIRRSGSVFPAHRVLDRVKVKGKKTVVELIQILDEPYPKDSLELFEQGRHLYSDRNWNEAIQKFRLAKKEILTVIGIHDEPCEIYINRCEVFQNNPPAESWDGSWEMDSK